MNKPITALVISGFGNKGIDTLRSELESTNTIVTQEIPSAPWYRALHHPETIINMVDSQIGELGEEATYIIGHSYGALIALAVACRRQFSQIKGLILIDGPIRPDVNVNPAKAAHNIFFRHYAHRQQLASECFSKLADMDSVNILTLAGQNDRVVPYKSKLIDEDHGHNFVLPEEHRGHSLTSKIPIYREEILRYIVQTIST